MAKPTGSIRGSSSESGTLSLPFRTIALKELRNRSPAFSSITNHCHSLPNYQFASAVDTIKTLIDIFPDDFPRKARRAKPSGAHGKS